MQPTRARDLLAAIAVCIGCMGTAAYSAGERPHSGVKRAPNTSAATWRMPWQIRPIGYGSRRGERIVEALVRKTGRVRGTPAAVATIGQPLRPARGPNRTVKACRAAVSREAVKLGAREVEAASAGRERRTPARHFAAPVTFRITYRKQGRYEVRLSVLTCVVNRKGRLLNAFAARSRPRRTG